MANLALNVTVKWKFLIVLLSIVALAGLFFYSSVWKNWRARRSGVTANENIHTKDKNVQEKYLEWDGVDKGIFYREIVPENSKYAVLLLHGAKFTSNNWQAIGTLAALSSNGYTVIAVDLPKYGSTRVKEQPEEEGKIQFLAELIKKLNLDRPVIVAPSMSGSYALPFVMDEKHSKDLRGFIPIAPAAVAKYSGADLKGLDLPTLIVYGENDGGFEQYVDRMKEIPGSEVFMMKDAHHPCYLDNPEEFHKKVVEFLDKLNEA